MPPISGVSDSTISAGSVWPLILFPPEFTSQRDEGDRDYTFPVKLMALALPHLQILQMALANRNDQPPALIELV